MVLSRPKEILGPSLFLGGSGVARVSCGVPVRVGSFRVGSFRVGSDVSQVFLQENLRLIVGVAHGVTRAASDHPSVHRSIAKSMAT